MERPWPKKAENLPLTCWPLRKRGDVKAVLSVDYTRTCGFARHRCIRPLPPTVCLSFDAKIGNKSVLPSASDGNLLKNPILLWLRSIDRLNTHDASYGLAIAGGVTTAQIFPSNPNNIGTHHVVYM
jgi:hypothetical protein